MRRPRLLLLDEATSALDSASEQVVQQALDVARQGRTTLVVAHRLSTIRAADTIAVVRLGKVVELGRHDELLSLGGLYSEMVRRQESTGTAQIADGNNEEIDCEVSSADKTPDKPPQVPGRGADDTEDAFVCSAPNARSDSEALRSAMENAGKRSTLLRLLSASRPEMCWIAGGILCAGLYGTEYPLFSFLFGQATAELQGADGRSAVSSALGALAGGICAVGFGAGLCVFGQNACFSVVGERLTSRLRNQAFGKLLRRRVGYFDGDGGGASTLCARLATEAAEVRGAAAERLGLLAQNVITAALGALLALSVAWKLGLVVLACVPLMTLGAVIENRLYRGGFESLGDDEADELLGQVLQQIRTVTAFTLEVPMLSEYGRRLKRVTARGIRLAHVSGAAYGFSQGIQYAIYGIGFWYGGELVLQGEWDKPAADLSGDCAPLLATGEYADLPSCAAALNLSNGFGRFMEAFWSVLLACWGVGEALSFAPDASKAVAASSRIFEMIEAGQNEIEVEDDFQCSSSQAKLVMMVCEGGKERRPSQMLGEIELRDVWFRYPSRPETAVLQDFSLRIPAGKTTALVGESGCGKSTVVQLLLRFYDVEAGAVLLDGADVRELGVSWLRRQIGLVSQEPVPIYFCFWSNLVIYWEMKDSCPLITTSSQVLFGMSIRDNIAYGRLWESVTQEEVEEAARAANADGFVRSLAQVCMARCFP